MKLLSNQSLWIMRERETRAHTHAGWEDEKTTRLIILRPIFITVPSVISLTDSNSPQLCVRWQMKTNYGNCFVNLKADSLPSSRTYTDNPVGPRNYPLLTAHQHTCVPVRACVIPFVANPFVVKELWTCKCVCFKKNLHSRVFNKESFPADDCCCWLCLMHTNRLLLRQHFFGT